MTAFQAGEHISLPVADADIGGLARVLLLGNVEIAVLSARNVVGATHAGPLAEVVALGCKDLDALVRAVGDIELAVVVKGDAVRQMELALAFARCAPRLDEPAVSGKAVHAGVAIAVGHVDVTVGVSHHLGRVIEWPAARSASQLVMWPVSECWPRWPSSSSGLPSRVNDLATE